MSLTWYILWHRDDTGITCSRQFIHYMPIHASNGWKSQSIHLDKYKQFLQLLMLLLLAFSTNFFSPLPSSVSSFFSLFFVYVRILWIYAVLFCMLDTDISISPQIYHNTHQFFFFSCCLLIFSRKESVSEENIVVTSI